MIQFSSKTQTCERPQGAHISPSTRKNKNIEVLHERLTNLVKSERKITHEVLLCIQEIDATKAYAELGYSSLFAYLVEGQKYSEGAAQRRISAARLLKEVPVIQERLQTGSLNLSQLAKLSGAFRQERKLTGESISLQKKQELLQRLENKTGFETEKILSQSPHYNPMLEQKNQSVSRRCLSNDKAHSSAV